MVYVTLLKVVVGLDDSFGVLMLRIFPGPYEVSWVIRDCLEGGFCLLLGEGAVVNEPELIFIRCITIYHREDTLVLLDAEVVRSFLAALG